MKPFLLFIALFHVYCGFAQQIDRGLKVEKLVNTSESAISYKQKYALVIGINDYQDNQIPNLTYAVNDAKEITKLLVTQLGYDSKNVIVLTDSDATRTTLLDTLQQAFINNENVPENSSLLVYFAGHGSVSRSGNKGFLLMHDTREGSELATAIGMDEIGRIAAECRSKHVLFLVDACYGGFANRRTGSGAFVRNVWNQKSRQVITAGNSDEKVIESGAWQHSVFTKVLLDAMEKGEADVNNDNIISSTELYMYLEQRISYYAREKGGKQTPQLGKLTPDEGTFFLELQPGALEKLDENSPIQNDEDISQMLKSKVIINSNVKTARVFMDNIEIGYLNNGIFEYKIKPGFYKFDLKLEKYETSSEEILIHPDTTIEINLPLKSIYSYVNFNIRPPDATVLLNSNVIGMGSFVSEVPKGRHEIMIEKKGFKPEKNLINIIQDTTTLEFSIFRIQSVVEIVSSPSAALVIDNMDTLGVTPFTKSLDFGQHNLVFLKDDYTPKQLLIDIKESGLQRRDVLLELKPEVIVKKNVMKARGKAIGNFLINGALSYGSYLGYQSLNKKIKEEEDLPKSESSNVDIYKIGKYTTLGLSGIFAVTSTINLIKVFTISSKKEMRKNMQDKLSVSFVPTATSNSLKINYKF